MGCGANHNIDRYKLNEKYVQIELPVRPKQFKKLKNKYIQNHMYRYSLCPKYGGKIQLFEMNNSNIYA